MPPDFYELVSKQIENVRRENREDHGKIFDRLVALERSNHTQPCETLKEHVFEHKETKGKIFSAVLGMAVKAVPWLITGALAAKIGWK